MNMTERMERLERQVRRLRIAATVSIVALCAVVFMGATGTGMSTKVVRAQVFQVVDEAGKLRAALGMTPDGPGLALFAASNKAYAILGILGEENGPGLALFDESGRSSVLLSATGDDAGLTFFNKDGSQRSHLPKARRSSNSSN